MADTNEKKDESAACGCGGGNCCSGPGRWVWIILALAVAGVLIAKNSPKKEEPATPVARISPSAAQAIGSNAVAQVKALPRLVDLGAGKCIPCKMMAPILEDLKKTFAGKLEVQFIDVLERPEEGAKYRVHIIPTQIFYDAQGKELFRHEGFFGKEDILSKWKELGVELNSN